MENEERSENVKLGQARRRAQGKEIGRPREIGAPAEHSGRSEGQLMIDVTPWALLSRQKFSDFIPQSRVDFEIFVQGSQGPSAFPFSRATDEPD
jgi:hypothetical protein